MSKGQTKDLLKFLKPFNDDLYGTYIRTAMN